VTDLGRCDERSVKLEAVNAVWEICGLFLRNTVSFMLGPDESRGLRQDPLGAYNTARPSWFDEKGKRVREEKESTLARPIPGVYAAYIMGYTHLSKLEFVVC